MLGFLWGRKVSEMAPQRGVSKDLQLVIERASLKEKVWVLWLEQQWGQMKAEKKELWWETS
jgi:hypothetical protein